MREDYNSRGDLLKDATPHFENIEDLSDLDGYYVFDPMSGAGLKAYIQMLIMGK